MIHMMAKKRAKIITDNLSVNGRDYPVKIYVERRKNCSASIGKKAVYIHVPEFLPAAEQKKMIRNMKSWAHERLLAEPGRFEPKPIREYHDGDVLQVGAENYLLSISLAPNETGSARLRDNCIRIILPNDIEPAERHAMAGTLISRCVAGKRRPQIIGRLNELNEQHFGKTFNQVRLKNNKTRWGSCSSAGNINISTRLLFAPDDVIDYVLIHELAHLVEPSHSKKFWSLVRRAMLDYETRKQWLKDHAHECRF